MLKNYARYWNISAKSLGDQQQLEIDLKELSL